MHQRLLSKPTDINTEDFPEIRKNISREKSQRSFVKKTESVKAINRFDNFCFRQLCIMSEDERDPWPSLPPSSSSTPGPDQFQNYYGPEGAMGSNDFEWINQQQVGLLLYLT